LIHEPWKLSLIEQQFYQCEIGKDYPEPIVDIDATRKKASDIVSGVFAKMMMSKKKENEF
jgi:deoxyribodipyrimidine photo-lyase